tara:strand:+ start:691 stop:1098 length:408 start_codon:yes stop_codon:yes gene_type:complete
MTTNTTNDEMNIVLLSYLLNIVFVIYFVFMRGEPFDYETFCLYMDEYKKACEEEDKLPKKKIIILKTGDTPPKGKSMREPLVLSKEAPELTTTLKNRIICSCGEDIDRLNLNRHSKSKKHIKRMEHLEKVGSLCP